MEKLKQAAQEDGYFDEVKGKIDELGKTLAADKANDLVKNRKDIEELLRTEIVGRYYYQKGRIVANLKNDPDLNRAFEILLNTNGKDEYRKILGK